ncbi:hypothetical protein DOTSEDRAFT_24464 [Dothistroma septosporum NZE10]|uniref:Up-regulated during septation protein 1 domain-containing protein n=1 Tax=Dothistroma septosporum (strain NZE10 / CBS 128990) TaxID=675120 RepID=N1PPW3_DOTSN|nr:hypothetical protein DOTSEDRAFT_24464 [Dothistroma septosporum NZE10]
MLAQCLIRKRHEDNQQNPTLCLLPQLPQANQHSISSPSHLELVLSYAATISLSLVQSPVTPLDIVNASKPPPLNTCRLIRKQCLPFYEEQLAARLQQLEQYIVHERHRYFELDTRKVTQIAQLRVRYEGNRQEAGLQRRAVVYEAEMKKASLIERAGRLV